MFNPSLPDGNLSTIFPGHTDRCDVDIGWGGGEEEGLNKIENTKNCKCIPEFEK